MAGVIGGGLSTVLLHPLDTLKTRQAVYGGSLWRQHMRPLLTLKSAAHAARNVYHGVGANILVSASSWGVYFATYVEVDFFLIFAVATQLSSFVNSFRRFETLKKLVGSKHETNGTIMAALGAGTITNLITNPLSVIRARMLLASNARSARYSSVLQSLLHIAKNEGIAGFYKVFKILLFIAILDVDTILMQHREWFRISLTSHMAPSNLSCMRS